LLKEDKLDLSKGDFAHVLSEVLLDPTMATSFKVPNYICSAIRAALLPVAVPALMQDEADEP